MLIKTKKRVQLFALSQLFCFLRSVFSLRHFVRYIPISTPATRLSLSARRLERNAQLYVAQNGSETEMEESSLTTNSVECSSSQLSLVPMNGPFDSSFSDLGSPRSKSSSDLPPVAVRYVGDLPSRTAYEHNATPCPPTIFVFDADRGEFEKYRSEVAVGAEVPSFAGPEVVNKRCRRIFARCDAWLSQSTQFYGQPPESQPASVAGEYETQSSTSSAVLADDSVSQVAAKKLAGVVAVQELTDADRIANLEIELAQLRAQLAKLVFQQERDRMGFPATAAFDGEKIAPAKESYREITITSTITSPHTAVDEAFSDSGVVETASSGLLVPPSQPAFSGPVPPPPPPPPPPSPSTFDWRSKLLEKRGLNTSKLPQPAARGDMSQVLKELTSGSIKLRSVRRSTGGTPIRERDVDPSRLDPTELIARALKAKFANMRRELDSPESPESLKRQPKDDENDNEFTPPLTPIFQTPMPRRVRDRGAEDALRSSDFRAKQGATSDAATSATLPFGRHMLRPVNRDKLPVSVLSELSFDTPNSSNAYSP
ncbi:protein of unknown function DUF729 [Echinococcus multilocularis]|uniref:Mitochondrial fission regulator 2 n=1 Tax=Echinococcus multilocularis TaxID=6211 RepID=A0A087VZE1_ECHMU|nr:protein of unknown function DUF729 [Echinococcus multilocularis]